MTERGATERGRIDFRVSDEATDAARALALERGFVDARGRPIISQLMRALLYEEIARRKKARQNQNKESGTS